MAATLDQVLAAVNAAAATLTMIGRKQDILISEMGIVMSLQDDLAAATATLQTETGTLLDSNAKLTDVLDQLRAAVAANAPVDPQVVADFEAALGQHKGAVDNIAALAAPVPDPPVQPPAV